MVKLAAGTYTVSSTITSDQGRRPARRGLAGSGERRNDHRQDRRRAPCSRSGPVRTRPATPAYGTACRAHRGRDSRRSTTVHVGVDASGFSAGDLALRRRGRRRGRTGGRLPVLQAGRPAAPSASGSRSRPSTRRRGTLTLSSPLHWTFRSASAAPRADRPGHPGPSSSGRGSRASRCRAAPTPATTARWRAASTCPTPPTAGSRTCRPTARIGGMHVSLTGTYRCVVRDSHFHNSANYGFGADCYGIVLRCGAADNLVENNIVRYMNKPILFNVIGRRQRHRLQLRRQLLGDARRVAGGQHRHPLLVPAHGADGGQLRAAHGRDHHARQRRLPDLLPQLRVEPVRAACRVRHRPSSQTGNIAAHPVRHRRHRHDRRSATCSAARRRPASGTAPVSAVVHRCRIRTRPASSSWARNGQSDVRLHHALVATATTTR